MEQNQNILPYFPFLSELRLPLITKQRVLITFYFSLYPYFKGSKGKVNKNGFPPFAFYYRVVFDLILMAVNFLHLQTEPNLLNKALLRKAFKYACGSGVS